MSRVGEDLSTVYERLASGSRLNRASDDAASLAIADTLKSSSRVLGTALRNIDDGISALNIVDGALSQQGEITKRLSELAEQSATGTLSYSQRAALQKEFQALTAEYFRIAETTSFNGRKLLSANVSDRSFLIQAGITGNDAPLQTQLPFIQKATGVLDLQKYTNSTGTLDFMTTYFDDTEVTQTALDTEWEGNILNVQGRDDLGRTRDVAVLIGANFGASGSSVFMKGLVRSLSDSTKWEGSWDILDLDDLIGGNSITVNADGTFKQNAGTKIIGTTSSNITFDISSGTTTSVSVDLNGLKFKNASLGLGASLTDPAPLDSLRLAVTDANIAKILSRQALDALSDISVNLASKRGIVGAFMGRLGVASSNTSSMRSNYNSAEASIRDSDVAQDASDLLRSQILQQIGSSILAQVNHIPDLALQLLR